MFYILIRFTGYLIDNGSDVNFRQARNGMTPLLIACASPSPVNEKNEYTVSKVCWKELVNDHTNRNIIM